MICPHCRKRVKPQRFDLWPGASIRICPLCRIGIGAISDDMEVAAIDAPPRDKMVRRAKKTK